MLLADILFCQQNGMRGNLFRSAGYCAVALIVGSSQKQRQSNNVRQNTHNATLWSDSQHQEELDYIKLAA